MGQEGSLNHRFPYHGSEVKATKLGTTDNAEGSLSLPRGEGMCHTAEGTSEKHRHWSGGKGEGERYEQELSYVCSVEEQLEGASSLRKELGGFQVLTVIGVTFRSLVLCPFMMTAWIGVKKVEVQ